MADLQQLPPDQRAVLQLVLQRGRGYDDIARMLDIDRAAVRERALAAFDALGPPTRVPAERRALLTDYLLGQLPSRVAAMVHERLAESASERAWARVIAGELAPLAGGGLPEIPGQAVRRAADAPADQGAAAGPPHSGSGSSSESGAGPATPASRRETSQSPADQRSRPADEPRTRTRQAGRDATAPVLAGSGAPSGASTREADSGRESRSGSAGSAAARPASRRGGAVLLGIVTLAIIAAILIVLSSGGSSSHHSSSTAAASSPTTPTTSSPTATTGTGTTTGAAPRIVAQINLLPAQKGSRAAGIAEILKQGTNTGVAIVAQGVPANTTHPPNSYAVWLYNSPGDARLLGFVNPGVGSNGRLSTAGGLPSSASHFRQLIVTLETVQNPRTPGQVVLAGTLRGL